MPGPRLDLDWEEGLFRGLLALWKRVVPVGTAPDPLEAPRHVASWGFVKAAFRRIE